MKSVDRHERREEARARFEERMAMPILIAAALLTAVTLVLLFADISRQARRTLLIVDLVIWALFAFDYLVRFTLATPKKRFVREEWLDLVLVVLPLLQPLRLAGAIVLELVLEPSGDLFLLFSERRTRVGFVESDGKRVVLWISSQPKDFGEIEDLDWGTQPSR